MIDDNLKLTGALSIAVNDTVVQEVTNIVVTAGKGYVASRLKESGRATEMGYMAIGTGTGTAAVANTTLGTELDRNALTSTTVSGVTVAYVGQWNAGDGTGAITEAGIFNASSGGTMLARVKFDVINKGANDSMTITWTITVN